MKVVYSLGEVPGPALGERDSHGPGIGVGEGDVAEINVVGVPFFFCESVVLVGRGEWKRVVML